MGLGVITTPTKEIWELPLRSAQDTKWEDKSWIVEHLRQLADKIESENISLHSAALKSAGWDHIPQLVIEVFRNR